MESVLDEGTDLNQSGDIREIMKTLLIFYNKEYLDSTTDLDPSSIGLLTKIEIKDRIYLEEFGVDVHLRKRVVEPLELRYRSKKRLGRIEGIGALSMQVTQLMTKGRTLIDRGLGTGG